MTTLATLDTPAVHHTPSLVHLRDFAQARIAGRRTHVAQDREQILAPSDGRFFAFAYERFLSGAIAYINDGCRGSALQDVVNVASPRIRPSYEAAARGIHSLLGRLDVRSARRQQRNVVVLDEDGTDLVSLRLHLILELGGGERLATHLYFPEQALTPAQLALMETSIAIAAHQRGAGAAPALLMVRTGILRPIAFAEATSARRLEFLRVEAEAYKTEWALSV
ncbi:hypothetical protein SAMN06295924_1194 [Rathayibacter rathayi NCPPB 2980 = VKM Ac-1601]|uniref:Uncharacterized protein n=1 Tax=Rathayibacter rathayi TaxID=33887 RepID=A0ABX5AEC8_RATRA|nr:hypothetical protein [Rathayibacter rathayi]MWV75937.1 hypothetical protein [Rathayibacter rathayi NCPPB 2980 = VKM Ac-1601]PPG66042.1 hypothetical protein C5C16_12050 [Rathayibacter rathayi]PPG75149.1 hypothetical protein C5C15_13435 [Rathayibacter rathayi]PPG87547.1 hypothetical protein C5C47_10235 [Rathayibacter rathayi]PPG95119.1 hypothetical protein C5C00_10905 [Rathayibacter rathayi]